MWLINTTSLKLSEKKNVQYAILSHRWEKEEITFQDLQPPLPEPKCGWKKPVLSEGRSFP
jgi:hypothetical protein